MPTLEQLAAIYSNAYYDEIYPVEHYEEQKKLFGLRLEQIEAKGCQGQVLDLGCGRGAFVEAAMQRGWTVVAQEFSQAAIERIKQRLGVEVLWSENPEELAFETGRFDLVHCNHVLEHLYRPNLVLSELHRVIKPGGYLYCEVPRESNLLNRLSGLVGGFGFEYMAEHLYLFDKPGLSLLLQEAGFEVDWIRIEGMEAPHRFVKGIHYQSAAASLIVLAASLLRMQNWLGGGNLASLSRR
ncbi:MAG: class I SAM-dependent methyltransferase [bacterium]|nr:class I SAM-dependent methyltransferase [bacterium]